jgi:eukaryotic-like serine/threonine-protein kinase
MTLQPGYRLGPYEILELRGKGGMGEVYRARDTRLAREVAIKVLPAELSEREQFRQRLRQEAKSVSQLGHPHVCALFDIGSEAGVDYLVLEYLEGETLEERLRRGPLPLEEVLRFGAQVARGVGAAHRKQLVHRDLKPGNVMVTPGGAKVLDFGLSRIASAVLPGTETGAATPAALTAEGALVGTLHYMSPEQLAGKEADTRSDVFALGALLYEMVTGERPFRGSSAADLIASILRSQPEPLSRRGLLTPPRLERLVSRCLEKDPERRWQSAHDVALELESIAADEPDQRAPTAAPRRRPVAMLAGAALIAGLALGLAFDRLVDGAPNGDQEPSWTTTELDLPLPRGYLGRMLALAPDGRTVAFVGETGSSRQINLRRLDSLDITPVRGTEGVEALGWFSPEASTLTFRQGRELRNIAVLGGTPSTLVQDAWSGRFGGDGFLYYSRLQDQATRDGSELWRVPVDGGNAERAGHGYVSDAPIPGTRVLLTHAPGEGDARDYWSDIEALDLETGVQRALARGVRPFFVAPGFLVFYRDNAIWAAPFDPVRDELGAEPRPIETRVRGEFSFGVDFGAFDVSAKGDLLYRSSGTEGAASLVWIGRDGRLLGEVSPERRGFQGPALSPDARSLAASVRDALGSSERWLLELETGSWTRPAQSGPANLPVSRGRVGGGQTWISDGREIVFSSNHRGYLSSYVQPADGSAAPIPLLEGDFAHLHLDVSPDGRYVLFSPLGPRGLSVYDRESREVRSLEPSAWLYSACFHPSGRWIAYALSVDAANTASEVWVRPFPGAGEPRQISTGGATEVLCSRDGREIYYRSPTHVMAVPVTVTEDRLRSGRPVALFEDPFLRNQVNGLRNYEVHPGGRFLMVQVAGEEDDGKIVLVQNWVAKLRRAFADID